MKYARIARTALALACLSTAAPALAANYTFMDLGSLDVTPSSGVGINNVGQVTGNGGYAFITGNGGVGMTGIGSLGGGWAGSYGINDRGQITGNATITGGSATHAFITGDNGSGMVDLGTLGGANSYGYATSNYGTVGYSDINNTSNSPQHAFITQSYTGGAAPGMTDIGTLGGAYSYGYGINDTGHVVGQAQTSTGAMHAFMTGDLGLNMVDLGTLGGSSSSATDINNAGVVVGSSYTYGNVEHAFIVDPGLTSMQDIGTLGGLNSYANAVNFFGQVVGNSFLADNSTMNAFLWQNGSLYNLNSFLDAATINAGWVLGSATDINDNGWITGTAFNSQTGAQHAYLLSLPSTSVTSAVPEPRTWAMLLAGLGLMGFIARRKSKNGMMAFA